MPAFPTMEDYREVFRIEHLWLQKPQKRLMQIHLRSPSHALTATELATQMGYPNHGSVNVHYGSLAARVSERLIKNGVKWTVPVGEPASVSMVIFERDGPEEHWRWIMRPELVEALTSLGWR